jgi:hypothetical protein
MTPPPPNDAFRRHVAAEVLELGETLFDAVLDAAADRVGAEGCEPLPEAELRTAAEEFFRTVRALLGLPESGTPDGPVP